MVVTTFWMTMTSIFCIGLIILSLIRGYKDGFVLKVVELLSMFLSIPIAWWFANALANKVKLVSNAVQTNTLLDSILNGLVNKVFLFVVIFILLRIVVMLCRPLFKRLHWIPLLGSVNQWAGALLGFLQSILLLIVITFLLSTPLFVNGEEVLEKTKLIYVRQLTIDLIINPADMNILETIQKWGDDAQTLVEEDYQKITNWMESQQFTLQEQEDIIEVMKNRNQGTSYE